MIIQWKNKKTEQELELAKTDALEEFNDTKVEPINFLRKTLIDDEDCLSYL